MPVLRPMLPSDVDAATEMILSNDWGVRRDFLAFATSQPACTPMVAESDGAIVGTGVGTLNGAVGWIGTIFVDPGWRGQGLGRAITQSIIDRLDSGGARTLVLVATADGRRLYSTMGFEVQTRYRILEAPGFATLPAGAPNAVRAFRPDDVDGMVALDRIGSGEERGHLIRRFATPDTAKVLPGPDGSVDGFVIRAPWGGGATVARSFDAATAIIDERRVKAGPEGRVRVGLLQENEDGLARLEAAGFTPQWAAPRMVRGEPMAWHPEWIWGQFNHAIG
ncbi:MAG: GNAT family N-acetyltransferase [Chloroflexi bacterium]|nr:GNAT family N-acetyltransferase [Chloroflexota bacterium]